MATETHRMSDPDRLSTGLGPFFRKPLFMLKGTASVRTAEEMTHRAITRLVPTSMK